MFALHTNNAHFAHLNVRIEKAGDETQLAVDLKLTISAGNDILDVLDPELVPALYRRGNGTDKPDLVETAEENELRAVRWPEFGELKYEREVRGCAVTLADLMFKDRVRLTDASVDSMRIHPQEGGTVKLTLRVQALPANQMAMLSALLDRKLSLSIEQGDEAAEQQAIVE